WIKKIQFYSRLLDTSLSTTLTLNSNKQITLNDLISLHHANKNLLKKDKYNSTSLLTFRYKLLTHLLPTREKLHIRYPLLYPNDTCPRCLIQPETQNHIFTCTANQIVLQKINAKIYKTLIKHLPKNLLPVHYSQIKSTKL